MKIGAIIPALNAARYLTDLIQDIKDRHPGLRVLVVDDGSSDGTTQAARSAGAEVICHPENQGKGAALATGYGWARDQGLDLVFTLDADGQHLPAEMKDFLAVQAELGADAVVGDRMAETEGMPWMRKQTNRFTSWVISRLAGCRIPDSQNGYRLYNVRCLGELDLQSSRYDAESEILVRLARRGYMIASVPVSTVYGDQVSTINPLIDTWRFFRLVLTLSRKR